MYKAFTRTWWKHNKEWTNGLEPHAGRKCTIKKNIDTEEEAHSICQVWNANNKPGKLSRKAEYERT